ncbi:SusC/RagA family TonB-linked outer membrane protein [Mucilaginibacter sp. SG564]|uniref:SusC/RagA family TonB-linked outer membrane protein n=1 Tax=Mucilaginibacter sp. SG564 TaxID=2587022 RepID=UPI001553BB07|nr:SusC/RagA family TonB-linked outer membrane protein [Mucilaginibacter sp. SG564]NOW96056.1 TonB-linked SusC/RagA family outer membrane protein [Mucilaginibacter sp. SG564]
MYKNYTNRISLPFRWQKYRNLLLGVPLFLCLIFVASVANAQSITASFKNAPLKSVIKELRKQSHYSFFIAEDLLNTAQPVTLSVQKENLKSTLDLIFKDSPLTFIIEDRSVTITEKDKKPGKQKSSSASVTALGLVYNEDHDPLEGATIRVKNKDLTTTTQRGGVFTLPGVEEGDLLQVTYIGYAPETLSVTGKYQIVNLKRAQSELDEVQVIFNGKTSLRSSTGSQVTITHEQLAVSPSPNIIEALAGLVPGLTITQNGPNASANYAITLRGTNALPVNGSSDLLPYVNQPLILLDGFPIAQMPGTTGGPSSSGQLGTFSKSSSQSANGLSALFSLNPADIESVTVLKDADATAIYGTRGANGVIIITTRKAKGGDLVASASVLYGLSTYARKLDLMNTDQYLAMRRQAYKTDGKSPTASDGPDLLTFSQTQNTNWQKELLGSKPTYTANFSVSGGKGTTTFIANGGYFYSDGGVKGAPSATLRDYNEKRTSFSLSTQSVSANGRLHLDSYFGISVVNNDLPAGSLESLIFLAPNAPSLFDAQGNPNFAGWAEKGAVYPGSAPGVFLPTNTKNTATNANIKFGYEILKGLIFNLESGYSINNINSFFESSSLYTTNPSTVALYASIGLGTSSFRSSSFNYGTISNFTLEPNLNYNRKIGKGYLNALAGISYNDQAYNTQSFAASGFTNDYLERSLVAAGSITPSANLDQQKLASAYARLNYSYNARYILMVSGRRDGASTFGPDKRWGSFGSVGGAWVFSDEEFLKKMKSDFFSFGKLRSSYGITGTPVNSSFGYLSTFTAGSGYTYEGQSTFNITQASNPDIRWSQTKKLDIGTDLGFLNDQLVVAGDVYRSLTDDQIVTTNLGSVTGLNSQVINLPAKVQNKGLEISISYRSEAMHKLTWYLAGNIAFNANKLVSFPNLKTSAFANFYDVGQPIGRVRVYNLPPLNSQTGVYDYTNIPPNYVFVNFAPKFAGGIQQGINYKGFSLSLNYEYRSQAGFNSYSQGAVLGSYQSGIGNQLVNVGKDSWKSPGDQTIFPKLSNSYTSSFFLNSQWLETQVFYISLKNARLGYTLPKSAMKKIGINSLGFNLAGNNLFYITNYKGPNPESPNPTITTGSLLRRQFSAGINATF